MLRAASLLVLLATLGACASILPDRIVHSTVTLAPGQSMRCRMEVPDGSYAGVRISTGGWQPVAGEDGTQAWVGEEGLLIRMLDGPLAGPEHGLGFVHLGLDDAVPRTVEIRNVSTEPKSFDWVLGSASDANVAWDLGGTPSGTQ